MLRPRNGNIAVVRGIVDDKKGRYLFGKRQNTAHNDPDRWEFPGGSSGGGKLMPLLFAEKLVKNWAFS